MIQDAKDYMITRYVNGEPISEEEWLLYLEEQMEECARRGEYYENSGQ